MNCFAKRDHFCQNISKSSCCIRNYTHFTGCLLNYISVKITIDNLNTAFSKHPIKGVLTYMQVFLNGLIEEWSLIPKQTTYCSLSNLLQHVTEISSLFEQRLLIIILKEHWSRVKK